jgi:hypothetical protein
VKEAVKASSRRSHFDKPCVKEFVNLNLLPKVTGYIPQSHDLRPGPGPGPGPVSGPGRHGTYCNHLAMVAVGLPWLS